MKQLFIKLAVCIWLCIPFKSLAGSRWQQVNTLPAAAKQVQHAHLSRYLVFATDESSLKLQLFTLQKGPANAQIIELPMPDGTTRDFKVWHTPIMPDELAAKYPDIRTFTAEAIDNPNVTAKLDFTPFGFHAMIFDGASISFIDPAGDSSKGYYTVHYKKDELRAQDKQMVCAVQHTTEEPMDVSRKAAFRTDNGYQLRAYRLALACSHQYASAATGFIFPTVAQTLSKMVTSMNRINGVYEREFSITMNLVANEDTIIFTTAATDPFSNDNLNASQLLIDNQHVCDTYIGNANYDIGHVFTTGGGGLSQVGVVCLSGLKAESETGSGTPVGDGFDIDYVAHEMGHEFGADHPFNDGTNGSCAGGNLNAPTAYEPGSGSTIMAYAGICAPDDLQEHSDPYFHAISMEQIQSYITTSGDVCAIKTATNNKLVSLPSFTKSYTIPYLTPFELTAPAYTDSVADSTVLYCWEQWNLGDVGKSLLDTHNYGPIFRSYSPTTSPTRVFPRMSMVLAGSLSDAGNENAQGEKAPDVARSLTFRLTMRDIYQGTGCFLIPDDTIHLDAVNTGRGFTVTSQNTAGLSYIGNTTQTITWDVAQTDVSPINASSVDIYISPDGGNSWTFHVGSFINNGSATVILPNPDTIINHARIKVKGTDNVFFNVNSNDFILYHNHESDTTIDMYPIPAHSSLRVSSGNNGALQGVVYNTLGQQMWTGVVDGQMDIIVTQWARGLYIIKLTDAKNHKTVRKFIVD